MKITDLVLTQYAGDFPADELRSEDRQAQPLDVYAEFAGRERGGDGGHGPKVRHAAVFLEVHTDEGVTGLFGPVDDTAREFLRLQCDRWQVAPWTRHLGDGGRIPPDLFQEIWPPDVAGRITALRDKALAEMANDPIARQRFLYWTWTFDAFLKDAETIHPKKTP